MVSEGYALEYASETLCNDREVVLAAVVSEGYALEYASETLCNDREVVLAAVVNKGCALEYASETLCNDRQVVLTAVNKDGCALEYASEALRNDRETALTAVENNWCALFRRQVVAVLRKCDYRMAQAAPALSRAARSGQTPLAAAYRARARPLSARAAGGLLQRVPATKVTLWEMFAR